MGIVDNIEISAAQALEAIIERTFIDKIDHYRDDDERTFFEEFADDESGCAYNENVWLSPKLIVELMYQAYKAGLDDAI